MFTLPNSYDDRLATVMPSTDALHDLTEFFRQFPRRPAIGREGTPTPVRANYFEVKVPKDIVLYQFSITRIQPTVGGRKTREILRALMSMYKQNAATVVVTTDFRSLIVSTSDLTKGEVSQKKDVEYMVTIEYGQAFSLSELVDYVKSTNSSVFFSAKQGTIQALNILRNYHSQTAQGDKYVTVGAHRVFQLGQGKALGYGMECMSGFFAGFRLATDRVLANVNVSHASFYRAGSLVNLMHAYGLSNTYQLAAFLKRLKVQPTLKKTVDGRSQYVHGIRTIWGLATVDDGRGLEHPPRVSKHGANPYEVEFWCETENRTSGYITIAKFFEEKYNRRLQHSDNLVINVGTSTNPVYLPPEICDVPAGQVTRTKLNGEQMSQMIRISARSPDLNANAIQGDGLKATGLYTGTDPESNTMLKSLGFQVATELMKVDSRILRTPRVEYTSAQKGASRAQAKIVKASWNLFKLNFTKIGTPRPWTYVIPDGIPSGKAEAYKQNIATLKTELGKTGLRLSEPVGLANNHTIPDVTEASDPAAIAGGIFRAAASGKARLGLIVVLMDRRLSAATYAAIKRLGDTHYGIATICVSYEKLAKQWSKEQYIANVSMKFNLKLGGNNQLVRPKFRLDDTMIVGIDVTHPSPGSNEKAPSVAGMVASVDANLGQWPAVLRRQREARKEMVTELAEMLKTRLKLWFGNNKGKYPRNILVYRDGVSEGQYAHVLKEELPLLRQACRELYPATEQKNGWPRITIVVVGKRHHTRFYPTTGDENTGPGTVVDTGVTESRNWEFFMQAHDAIKGTARPIHYFVVHDEIFKHFSPQTAVDNLEDLTHNLCYVYGRATKGVSLATPAYYADIVCERARCYLNRLYDDPSPSSAASAQGDQPMPSAQPQASAAGTGTRVWDNQEGIRLHQNLVNTMYYI
ncbi:putative RNA interference and gene silencing protein [Hypoxylon sp. FL1284]|nr:putative RNA interference and gene silencing protein [Hypoxylon sp. FL1284]